MSRRVSHSLLAPIIGHLSAIAGAVGFAFSTEAWWGGVVGCLGVIGNHTADCLDGTHTRSTGQCRNGGKLLDHVTDPLMVGVAMLIHQLVSAVSEVNRCGAEVDTAPWVTRAQTNSRGTIAFGKEMHRM